MPATQLIVRGVIFDLDGTLGDTVSLSLEGFRRAIFKYSGNMLTDKEIRSMWGPTEEGIFMEMFPDRWQDVLADYLLAYDELHREWKISSFAGLPETLDFLKSAGVRIAVVTAKGAHSANISLKHFGMLDVFEYVETGSHEGLNKAERIEYVLGQWVLPKENVLYVGDFPSDIAASREAGVPVAGVTWASTADADELSRHRPDYLFNSVKDFHEWLAVALTENKVK